MKKNVVEIAKEYFPNATKKELYFIIWEETGYPTFFAPKEGETAEDVFRQQLIKYKNSIEINKGE